MTTRNRYSVKYEGIVYPTLSLASIASGVKRTTLTKAVNIRFRSQVIQNNLITLTIQGESFKITKFTKTK